MNEDDQLTPSIASAESLSPAIYIKSLKPGTVLLLEGETDMYEFIVQHPEQGIIEVSSNNEVLRHGAVGQFMYSVRWDDPSIRLNAIQRGWAIILRFHNGFLQTQPILSASVNGIRPDGKRWHFDVF
jgi:hypothetical protein